MAARLSSKKCLFKVFFGLSKPKRDFDTNKIPPNIKICPESLGAMFDHIEHGLFITCRLIV